MREGKRFKSFKTAFFQKRKTLVLARELSPASYRSDEVRFEKILPRLGELTLSRITARSCDSFLDSLILSGKSPATRNRYRALLHTYFKYAINQGHCRQNPVTSIPIYSERLKTRKTGFWESREEVDRYIATAFELGNAYGLCASLLGDGGCRISEALAVKWEDVQWGRGFVRIRRIVERHTNKVDERTKGQRAGGEYQMLLSPGLEETLAKYRKDSGFIVRGLGGGHMHYDHYYKKHYEIIAKAKLKRITPHDIRRTFATHADRAGFHRSEVGELLGHETLKATETYISPDFSHLIGKAKQIGFGKKKS